MPLDLLDLPTGVIEQLAKVRLDAEIGEYPSSRPKTYVFWILRRLGHRGLYAAAWDARHSVLKPTLPNVATLGDAEWCRVMLEGGADVESNRYGWRAIHRASRFGHKDTVAVLLEHGADVNAVSGGGWSALRLATSNGQADTAALLREHGGVEW